MLQQDVFGDSTTRSPLILGEVLFDHFPNSVRVLGGAPFNVAWNLQGLGLRPRFVSAIGTDPEANEIRTLMAAWGLDQTGLQTCNDWPTGTVQVTLDAGEPSYEIVPNCAYDFVRLPEWPVTADVHTLFYYGSLACRNAVTRESIQTLKASSGLSTFVDVNIRPPWFDREWLPQLLTGARWVKLNREELSQIVGSACTARATIEAAVKELRDQFGCQDCWVTCGSDGAYAFGADDEIVFCNAPQPTKFVDAVGAGDAFAAVAIWGIYQGWSPARVLRSAVRFASGVCGIKGAICNQPEFYHLENSGHK